MSYTIQTRHESARGCGFRVAGGKYLVGGGTAQPCGLLPIELSFCPCCNQGIKQTRGFTWVEAQIFKSNSCNDQALCKTCPSPNFEDDEKVGLMWVGKKFYTPESFIKECKEQGISKRIAGLPKDFVVGETWIFLAHPQVQFFDGKKRKGAFYIWKPQAIEYIVTGEETDAELERLHNQGYDLVKVIPVEEQETELTEEEIQKRIDNLMNEL